MAPLALVLAGARAPDALLALAPDTLRNVIDSKNLCIGQYDKFFEEHYLLPTL
jgi:hypothetical protein